MDFDYEYGTFPQFMGTWNGVASSAASLANGLCNEADRSRFRVALRTADPQSFCALFVALASCEIDIFLFNPNWIEDELKAARKIAVPHWVLGDCENGSFEVTKSSEFEDRKENGTTGLRVMIPTGGTSGKIRFAIHNRSTLMASVRAFQEFFEAKRIISHCVLPLYHVSGFMQLVRVLVTGGRIVFGTVSDFVMNHSLLGLESEEYRFLSLVPTQLHRLLESDLDGDLLKSYRAILVGGGPVSAELLELGRKRNLRLAPTYGMTETASMVATLSPEAFLSGKKGQGFPLPHAEIEIVPVTAKNDSVAGIGRIKIKSSSLFTGFFGERERTGGGYLTNDLGEIGANGELTVHGRLDRVIISGGENISLLEIEETLLDTGLVVEATAFGIEDSDWGTRLCVAYVPKEKTLDEIELRRKVAQRLAGFKQPKSWLPMSALPRNDAGKVLGQRLKERLKDTK